MFALVCALAVLGWTQAAPPPAKTEKPVTLGRVFKLGQRMKYEVRSSLQIQHRMIGLETFIPEDLDIIYSFTTEVTKMKPDGIAELRYLRPTMTQIAGETADSGPVSHVEKTNLDFLLTVTPVNDIIDEKDMTPKKKDKPKSGGSLLLRRGTPAAQIQGLIGSYVQEIYRLSLFVGSLDSSLDFSPRLPLDDVSVGDTWKRTVGYSPQKVKGKEGKASVQRLDYTYTYRGIDTWNGKKVYKITSDLNLDSDLATFFNDMFDAKPEETNLKSIPLKLKANVVFYLDAATMHTLEADASTEGGFKVVLTNMAANAVEEQNLKGHSTMKLLGISQVPPAKQK